MTPEEAIVKLEVYSSTNGSGLCTSAEHLEAKKIAIKALEKQIPKPPEFWGDGYDEDGNHIYDNAKCPNCGNDDFEYGINNWGCDYCPDCGQALVWRDNK